MKERHVMPASLSVHSTDYFATARDDTLLSAPGIDPCIGGLFYRQGHIGLGHFDPMMDSVMGDLLRVVKSQMEKYGTGDIGCRLFTGLSFAAREEFQGNKGIEKYFTYVKAITELGFVFDEDHFSREGGSRTYLLANGGPTLLIKRLQARLIGESLDKVEVQLQYIGMGRDASDGIEESVERFEIDTKTHRARITQPFTGYKEF